MRIAPNDAHVKGWRNLLGVLVTSARGAGLLPRAQFADLGRWQYRPEVGFDGGVLSAFSIGDV